MKRTFGKKALSLAMTLAMMLSIVPTSAFAADPEAAVETQAVGVQTETQAPAEPAAPTIEGVAKIGEKGYATLAEAVNAAQDNQTVTLLKNIQLKSVSKNDALVIPKGKEITLDLNGMKLDAGLRTGSSDRHNYAIANRGKLTIRDSVGTGSISGRGVENFGTMVMESGTIYAVDKVGGASIWNEGTLTMTGGSLLVIGDHQVGSSSDSAGVGCLNNSGTVLITGGTFKDVNKRTYAIISTGKLEITPAEGSEVIVDGAHGGLAIDAGTAVVNGGTYSSTDFYGLYVSNDGKGQDPMNAAVTVNGGEFSGKSYAVWIGSDYNNPVNSSIAIKGGTFNQPLNAQDCTREGAIVVSGGTFAADPSAYVAADYEATKSGDVWTVAAKDYVAQVGEQKFESLQAAVDAAEAGQTVTMLQDVKANITVAVGQNIVLDLNGKTLNGGTNNGNTPAIKNNGTLVLKDSSEAKTGTVKREDGAKAGSYYTILNEGTMTIESGKVMNNAGKTTEWSGSSLICNGPENPANNAVLKIKGGVIEQDNFIAVKNDENGTLYIEGGVINSKTQAVQNWKNATITGGTLTGKVTTWTYGNTNAKTEITGGEIDGELQANEYDAATKNTPVVTVTGGTFSSDPTAYMVKGYEAIQADGKWVVGTEKFAEVNGVEYETLEAAIEAAEPGATVKLIKDVVMPYPTTAGSGLRPDISIDKNLILDLAGHTIKRNACTGSVKGVPAFFAITAGVNVTVTGNGVIDAELGDNSSYGINVNHPDAVLTIVNGTFLGAPTGFQVQKGTLNVQGGTYDMSASCKAAAPNLANYEINCIDESFKDGTAKINVTGGTFVGFNPADNPEGAGTTYVAPGFVVAKSGDNYTVSVRSAETPEVVVPENIENKEAVTEAAENVKTELPVVEAKPEEKAEAVEVAKQAGLTQEQAEAADVTVKTYMKVQPKKFEQTETSKSFILDITPMAVTTVTVNNTDIAVGAAKEVKITEPVTVTIPVPAGFANENDVLYIVHRTDNGGVYNHEVTVKKNADGGLYVTFENTHGFSEFEMTTTAAPAKQYDMKAVIADTTPAVLNPGDTVTVEIRGIAKDAAVDNMIAFQFTMPTDITGLTFKDIKWADGIGASSALDPDGNVAKYNCMNAVGAKLATGEGTLLATATYTVNAQAAEGDVTIALADTEITGLLNDKSSLDVVTNATATLHNVVITLKPGANATINGGTADVTLYANYNEAGLYSDAARKEPATVTVKANTGYELKTNNWTDGETEYADFAVIAALKPTANATYTLQVVNATFDVTIPGEAAPVTAVHGTDLTFAPKQFATGATYTVVGGVTDKTAVKDENGNYTIDGADIVGAVTVTYTYLDGLTKDTQWVFVTNADYKVLADNNVKLALLTNAAANKGYTLGTYGDMVWSEKYNAYVAIVKATDEAAALSAKLTAATTAATKIDYTGDLNGDGNPTAADTAVINAAIFHITGLTYTITDDMRLEMDLNGDKTVSTADIMKALNLVVKK